MKKLYTLLFMALVYNSQAQVTIHLRPDAAAGKDAMVSSLQPAMNFGSSLDFASLAWTNFGDPVNFRTYFQFDLSVIPAGAQIQSATLHLYNNPNSTSNNGEHSNLSGSNESVIQRVTGAWDESTITWNNMPASTSVNELTVPQSTSTSQDYMLNMTALVNDVMATGNTNHGFVLKLKNENYYRCLLFGTSDDADSLLRPKLSVTYSPLSVNDHLSVNLSVIPNKAGNEISLLFDPVKANNMSIAVNDLSGKQVIVEETIRMGGANSYSVTMPENLSSGIYIVSLTTDSGRVIRKFLW